MEKDIRKESLGLSLDEEINSGLAERNSMNENCQKSVKKEEKKKVVHEAINYSDYELLDFLEESGYKATMKNLNILKEGLANGSITLEPEGTTEAEKELEAEHLSQDAPEKVKSDLSKDSKSVNDKPAVFKESRIIRSHSDSFLNSYLTEDCGMEIEEVSTLTESEKIDSIRELGKTIASNLATRMGELDTSVADRSRGDIKDLKILSDLQNAITQLEAIVERADAYNPECKKYIGIVIKSILYLNQYSSVFKEAYRNKKTLLILRYETIIMSIISSTAYLIAQIVDFRSQTLGMKQTVEISEIAPLKTLREFVRSIDSGEFKIVTKDVTTLREYYKELPVERLSTLCESNEIVNLVVDGVKSIYDGLDKNKITQLLYKTTGVIVLLLSVRDAVYSLSRMKTRMSDMVSMISNFANINLGGGIKSLTSFVNRFVPDAESASEMAANEVSDDNRKLSTQLRAIKAAPVIDDAEPIDIPSVNPVGKQEAIPSTNDLFNF